MQYQLVVVVDPILAEKEAQDKITGLLEKEGYKVDDIKLWGKRTLAYPLKKKSTGVYFEFTITADKANPNNLYQKFQSDETILRHLVLRKEKEHLKDQRLKIKT